MLEVETFKEKLEEQKIKVAEDVSSVRAGEAALWRMLSLVASKNGTVIPEESTL